VAATRHRLPGRAPRASTVGVRPDTGEDARRLTLGVEEEYVLLDPASGAPALAAPGLLRLLDGEPAAKPELMRFQFEVATRVCTGLDEVRHELLRLRRLAGAGAERLGCRLVASGVAPYPVPGVAAVTDQARYRELARRFATLAPDAGTCGCHVHVGVPSRDLGVQVLARLRPWLAPLLAVSVNSPIANGRETAWASWRYRVWSRWPTARPPGTWSDAAQYDASVRRIIDGGAALDEASIYFLARLSPRYPTVEVRVADVCLDVDGAVLQAALVRALVATALAEARRERPLRVAPDRWVAAALTAAGRYGLGGAGVDPFTGGSVTQRELVDRLLHHVRPALDAAGDTAAATALLRGLDERGTGADRQRALWAGASSAGEFVGGLARATLTPATRPPRPASPLRPASPRPGPGPGDPH
jgi:carboxylate-amine ligase